MWRSYGAVTPGNWFHELACMSQHSMQLARYIPTHVAVHCAHTAYVVGPKDRRVEMWFSSFSKTQSSFNSNAKIYAREICGWSGHCASPLQDRISFRSCRQLCTPRTRTMAARAVGSSFQKLSSRNISVSTKATLRKLQSQPSYDLSDALHSVTQQRPIFRYVTRRWMCSGEEHLAKKVAVSFIAVGININTDATLLCMCVMIFVALSLACCFADSSCIL